MWLAGEPTLVTLIGVPTIWKVLLKMSERFPLMK